MKKLLSIILVIVMLFCFAACGSTGKGATVDPTPAPANNDPAPAPENDGNAEPVGTELSEPELIWWHVKTETGIPTLVAELKNNNSVAVDFDFNVDYYQNKEQLCTSQDLYALAIDAGKSTLIIDTWEIPAEADEIRISYTYLEASSYTVVPSSVHAEKNADGSLAISCQVDGDFDEYDVNTAFFSGDHCVAAGIWTFFSGDELSYIDEPLEAYDSYKIYDHAYIYK